MRRIWPLFLLVVVPAAVIAEEIPSTLSNFTTGTTISSTTMNAHFDAVETAVDDNAADIDALQAITPGDEVTIDGAATTDPDLLDSTDIEFILCTGSGAPDTECTAQYDVLARPVDGVALSNPVISGVIDGDGGSVDDDSCVGDQGKMWFDDTDLRWEFCNLDSSTPEVLGTSTGDDVQVNALTFGDGTGTSVAHTYDTDTTDGTLTFDNSGDATFSGSVSCGTAGCTFDTARGTSGDRTLLYAASADASGGVYLGIGAPDTVTATDNVVFTLPDDAGCTADQVLEVASVSGTNPVVVVLECDTDNTSSTSVTVDLGDDDSNDTTSMDEIAPTGDTNSIFGVSTNKLTIDVSANWPTSDKSVGVASTGNVVIELDTDFNTSNKLSITNGADTEVASVNEDGDLTAAGDLFTGGLSGTTCMLFVDIAGDGGVTACWTADGEMLCEIDTNGVCNDAT